MPSLEASGRCGAFGFVFSRDARLFVYVSDGVMASVLLPRVFAYFARYVGLRGYLEV